MTLIWAILGINVHDGYAHASKDRHVYSAKACLSSHLVCCSACCSSQLCWQSPLSRRLETSEAGQATHRITRAVGGFCVTERLAPPLSESQPPIRLVSTTAASLLLRSPLPLCHLLSDIVRPHSVSNQLLHPIFRHRDPVYQPFEPPPKSCQVP